MSRNAPYRHVDGSNCWTKNCSKNTTHVRDSATERETFLRDVQQAPTYRPVKLDSIAPLAEFEADVANRYIHIQNHPSLPLDIYDYTQSAQYENHWTAATLASRGLIVNRDTLEIVSRPLGKFFNHSEGKIDASLLRGPIIVTEKLDGSCGISYPTPDGLNISTRGSFASDQAKHATAIYQERYHGKWQPRQDRTYMWEIIYPSNRIVVDYGPMDDIVLIAAVNNRTGKSIPPSQVPEWPFQKVQAFEFESLGDVLASSDRDNHEGYVIHYPETDVRVKFKHPLYVHRHRIMTGVNSRRIWELLRNGDNVDAFLHNVPEEFELYVKDTAGRLERKHEEVKQEAIRAHKDAVANLPEGYVQKDYAQYVLSRYPKSMASMSFLVQREQWERLDASIWTQIEPEHEKAFFSQAKKDENEG